MPETTDKASHKSDTVELRQAIVEDADGQYVAVLSDNSVDRENEIIGRSALKDMRDTIADEDKTLSALLDHENKVENLVAEYENPELVELDGHESLIAEPKFFTANPKAEQVKGMLDQGANIGVSISAIPKSTDEVERDGRTYKRFTELETVEASFTPIPANRHARATSLAKSWSENNNETDKESEEVNLMTSQDNDDEDTRSKELDDQVGENSEAIKALADRVKRVSSKLDQVLEGIEKAEHDDADMDEEEDEGEDEEKSANSTEKNGVAEYVAKTLSKDAHNSASDSEPVRKQVSGDRDTLGKRKAEAEKPNGDEADSKSADTAEQDGVPVTKQRNIIE